MSFSPRQWLNKLRDWTLGQKNSPYAGWSLFFVAFIESSIFPIPPDVLLIAILALHSRRWKYFASIVLLGSLLGGMAGYLIGFGAFNLFGKKIVELYHLQSAMEAVGVKYSQNAFLTVFTAAFTPIPYKLITISAGVFKIDFWTFILASIIGRGARFFAVAYIMKLFGPKVEKILEKYFNLVSLIFLGLLVGGFLAIKYLF